MSSWFSLSGSIRVRRCPEAGRIFRKLRARHDPNFNVEVKELDSGELRIALCGCDEFAAGEPTPDVLLQSLAPYALEAAVFDGVDDYEPVQIIVAPPGEAGRVAMSRFRLDQIEPLLEELVPGDRVKLIEKLRMSPSGEARLATP